MENVVYSEEFRSAQSELFEKFGVFFAFNEEQFKVEYKKICDKFGDKTKLIAMGSGGYIPSKNFDEFFQAHEELEKKFNY